MRTWKKAIAWFLSLSMTLSLCAGGAGAEGTEPENGGPAPAAAGDVARIGEQTYETLAAAVEAAEADGDETVITLLADAEVDTAVHVTAPLTIEGAGCTISAAGAYSSGTGARENAVFSLNGGALTLRDVTVDAKGKCRVVYANAGVLTIDGADLTGGCTNSYVAGVYMTAGASFQMTSGSISGNTISGQYADDRYLQYSADLWIGANATGAYTNIEGGEIGCAFVNANSYSAANPGSFTMTGGTIGTVYVEYDSGYGGTFAYEGGSVGQLRLSTTVSGTSVSVTPETGTVYVGGRVAVASTGGVDYASLPEAIEAAADGGVVTLQNDVMAAEKITLSKSLTLDLNGHRTGHTGGSCFLQVIDGAALTIDGTTDGSEIYGRIDLGISKNNNGSAVLNGGVYSCMDGQTVLHINGTCLASDVTISGATITSPTDNGIQLNGAGTFLIEDSVITGATAVYVKSGVLTIRNSILTGTMSPANYQYFGNGANATGDALVVDACNYPGGDPTVIIESGTFAGTKAAVGYYQYDGGTGAISITGGTFSSDPSDHVASGYAAAGNDDGTYTVAGKTEETPVVAAPVIVPAVSESITDEAEKKAAEAISSTLAGTTNAGGTSTAAKVDGLAAVAADAAKDIAVDEAAAKTALEAQNIEVGSGTPITVAVVPTLEVAVTGVTLGTNKQLTELTVDITPVLKTVATTASKTSDIKLADETSEGESANAVVLEQKKAVITEPVTVTIPLPAGFAGEGDTLYIKHVKSTGATYVYTAEVKIVNGALTASFTNPNGFSQFTLTAANPAVAETGGVGYTSLQDAVDAVENNGTITVLAKDLTAEVGRTVTFKVDGAGADSARITAANADTKRTVNGTTFVFTYDAAPPSSGGGTVSACTLTFETNGGAAIGRISRARGTLVDLSGYVPVRDGCSFGGWYADADLTEPVDEVKLTRDTTVYARWTELAVEPPAAALPFADVTAGAYCYDAVVWAVERGIAQGMTAEQFGPDLTCTRGQMVTFLWRAAGAPEPAAAAGAFTDVPGGAYYEKAVLWAAEQGITRGTSPTTFGPDELVTRGQVAAFLWRAAGSPAPAAAELFADVDSGAYYADAVRWAAGAAITTGTGPNTFSPEAPCTRGQIVTFLYRGLGR